MTAQQDATVYSLLNTGVKATPTRDGISYSLLNTGVKATPTRDGIRYSLLNAGFPYPDSYDVSVPSHGWGSPLTEGRTTNLIPAAANAVAYTYEGDVTT